MFDQVWVRPWIVVEQLFSSEHAPVLAWQETVGYVELDRPSYARPEVDEEQPLPGHEQVARMRFTVQQLLAGAAAANRWAQPTERGGEEVPVGGEKVWSLVSVDNGPLRVGDSIGEVRCHQIDLAHAGMEPDQCVRIVGRLDVRGWSPRLVVGPERDWVPVTHVDAGLDPRVKFTDRAIGFGEKSSNLDFEPEAGFVCWRPDSSKHTARDHVDGDAVRVVNDDRVVDV